MFSDDNLTRWDILRITENIRLSKFEVVQNYWNEFWQTLEPTDKEIHENEKRKICFTNIRVNQLNLTESYALIIEKYRIWMYYINKSCYFSASVGL